MINVFVGYELANRYKKLRDRLDGRVTDSEFMVTLLNIWWDNNREQIDGYTQGRDESHSLRIQTDLSELGSQIEKQDESDIHSDKKSIHRSTKKQAKGSTPRRSRDGGKSV